MDQCMRWKLFILIKTCIFIIYWVWERIQTQWHESASGCPLIKQMVRFTWFPSLPILCCDTAVQWLALPPHTNQFFLWIYTENFSVWIVFFVRAGHSKSQTFGLFCWFLHVGPAMCGSSCPGCIQLKHCYDPKWCNRIQVWYQCHIFHTADQRWYLNLKGTQ